jgi:hypothetical protein
MDETMHWKMKWKDEDKSDIMKKLARSRTVDGVFYLSQYEGVGLDTYDELLGSPPTHYLDPTSRDRRSHEGGELRGMHGNGETML